MSQRVVFSNGQYIPEREARVSIFDSGLLYGDTAFEMTRTFRGEPFRLQEHLERLQGTLKFLEIDCGLSPAELEQHTLETLARNRRTEADDVDWWVRHDITRGPAELYASVFPEGLQPTVLISCWPLLKHMGRFAPTYDHGVHLMLSQQCSIPPTLINPLAKTRSRVHFQLASLEAKRHGPVWPLLTDTEGYVTEGPSWNILVLRDGTLYSPRGEKILHGVSRAVTFEAAARIGVPTAEADMNREFLQQAEEIYCSATSFGLVPVVAFEGTPVARAQPGPVYQQLLAVWKDIVGLDFVAQAYSYLPRIAEWEARERQS